VALVVHAVVETEVLDDVAALGRATRATDDPAGAVLLRQLAGDRPDGPRGGGDEDGVALLDVTDVVQPEPRGDAGVAEHAEEGGRGRGQGVREHGDRGCARAVAGDRVLLPP